MDQDRSDVIHIAEARSNDLRDIVDQGNHSGRHTWRWRPAVDNQVDDPFEPVFDILGIEQGTAVVEGGGGVEDRVAEGLDDIQADLTIRHPDAGFPDAGSG